MTERRSIVGAVTTWESCEAGRPYPGEDISGEGELGLAVPAGVDLALQGDEMKPPHPLRAPTTSPPLPSPRADGRPLLNTYAVS